MNIRNIKILLLSIFGVLVSPVFVYAVMQSLNSQTGQNQTFSNDTNVTISSSGGTHTLGWSGVLGISRGGTGINTTGESGEIFFSNFLQDSNLFWNPDWGLTIGSRNLHVGQDLQVNGNIEFERGLPGGGWTLQTFDFEKASLGIASGGGQPAVVIERGIEGNVPALYILPQGDSDPGNIGISTMSPDFELDVVGDIHTTGRFFVGASTSYDVTSLESTLYVGNPSKIGCLALGDSDGSGLTYIWASNGILSASSSKPAFCD